MSEPRTTGPRVAPHGDDQLVDGWWRGLDSARRRQALALTPGGPLSPDLAAGLRRAGVTVPEVAVGWDVDGVVDRRTVLVQPHRVTAYLEQVRAAATLTVDLRLAS